MKFPLLYVSRSSLRTSRHLSPDECRVIVHTTCPRLTILAQSRLLGDPRDYRAVSAQFSRQIWSGLPLDVTHSDITPPLHDFLPF